MVEDSASIVVHVIRKHRVTLARLRSVSEKLLSHLEGRVASADGFAAERVIGEWIGFYNTERPHSALAGRSPAKAYRAGQPVDMMDKAGALSIISTGSRTAAGRDKQNLGGMTRLREARFGGPFRETCRKADWCR